MDDLIARQATGTPEEFAKKLGLSRSALMKYLNLLREIDAPIGFCNTRRSYYYVISCKLKIGYESHQVSINELSKINKMNLRKYCEVILMKT